MGDSCKPSTYGGHPCGGHPHTPNSGGVPGGYRGYPHLPTDPHCAIVCGQTGCGKTVFVLDMLEGYYKDVFDNIVIMCPTLSMNKTYARPWVMTDPDVHKIEPGTRLQDWLKALHEKFKGEPTLFILDDCSANREITKKRDMLSYLAFSGRHANHSVWVLTQKFNSVLKDLREQTRWVALFHCKDRDSFEECLRENDVMSKLERERVKKQLAETKHAKLVLKTDQPVAYKVC